MEILGWLYPRRPIPIVVTDVLVALSDRELHRVLLGPGKDNAAKLRRYEGRLPSFTGKLHPDSDPGTVDKIRHVHHRTAGLRPDMRRLGRKRLARADHQFVFAAVRTPVVP